MSLTIYNSLNNEPLEIENHKGVHVVVSVPAAFSATCTNVCVPSLIEHKQELLDAGAESIMIVSCDPPFSIKEWIMVGKWDQTGLEFYSDYGSFDYRERIGSLIDEEGKGELPPVLGSLIRRSYSVLKDGEFVWQFIEPDSGEFSLDFDDLAGAIAMAHT
jgi:peroxiredoxin